MTIRRRDDVGVRKRDLINAATRFRQTLQRHTEGLTHFVVQAIHKVAARESQSYGGERWSRGLLRTVLDRAPHVESPHGTIDDSYVIDGLAEWADVVQSRCQRHHAFAAHVSERRLETDHAARCGRDSDRPAGVGSDRAQCHSRRDRRGRPATRTTGHVARGQWIAGGAVRRVLAGRPERELMKIALADEDGARSPQASKCWRIGRGAMASPDPGCGGGRQTAEVDQVLDGDRHAVQHSQVLASSECSVGLSCSVSSVVGQHRDKRVDLGVAPADGIETSLDLVCRRRAPFAHSFCTLPDRVHGHRESLARRLTVRSSRRPRTVRPGRIASRRTARGRLPSTDRSGRARTSRDRHRAPSSRRGH